MRKTGCGSGGNFAASTNHTDVQRQIPNQKVCFKCVKGFRKTCRMILMDKYESWAIPQNPHWHSPYFTITPFILPTKKLHEWYLLPFAPLKLHQATWLGERVQHHCFVGCHALLVPNPGTKARGPMLDAKKKHLPYSSIFIWSPRNFLNKTGQLKDAKSQRCQKLWSFTMTTLIPWCALLQGCLHQVIATTKQVWPSKEVLPVKRHQSTPAK